MEFLESLYEIENFGIYLFVIIGILVVLFLVVLFFGKKDQKMRKKLEEIEEEKPETTDEFAFQTTENATELNASVNNEIPEIEPHQEIPAVPEAKEEPTPEPAPAPVFEAKPTTNVVLNSDLELEPSPKEMPQEPPVETNEPDMATREFDFDALAEAISKELESIDNTPKKEPVKEEIPTPQEVPETKENNFQVFEPIRVEETSVKKEEPVKPVEEPEAKPRPVMPTVFSSVYVNREKEEPKKTEEPVKPVKPSIDLPKIADLPKRAEEPSTTPETLSSNKEDDGIIFR